ncbi:MAG: aminotransferase class I/II-fold pyridoxal phosphate-dependent enzyme [Acidobacteriota bacterium]
MTVSRRGFLTTVGAGSAAALAIPAHAAIAWRGREASVALSPQGQAQRRADRRMAVQPGVIRIDSNENPSGPGTLALEAIRAHLDECNRYPVLAEDDVINTIARIQHVAPENVLLGCGSGELLRSAVQAFTAKDRAYMGAGPTFEAPGEFAKFIGSPVTLVPVDGTLGLDLDRMAAAAKGAGLVFFCNPNNPTATVHSKSDVMAFVETVNRTSPDTTILVDEAYFEYVDLAAYGTLMPIALTNPRVVVTRTFSKVFGMAGLRLGYMVGRPETLEKVKSWNLGSNTNQLTLQAAVAGLNDTRHIEDEVKRNREVKAYTRKFFADLGYQMSAGEANFMMVNIKRDSKAFKAGLVKKGVAVGRQFPGLESHMRLCFGTMAEMKKALPIIAESLG